MQARVIIEGRYEIALTSRGDRVLSLNGVRAFLWTDGAAGDWLARASVASATTGDAGVRVLCVGEFFLIGYVVGPRVGDALHLFLSDGTAFEEYVLPHGIPTSAEVGAPGGRRIVATGERLSRAEVLQDVVNPPPSYGVVRTSGTSRSPPAPPTPPA